MDLDWIKFGTGMVYMVERRYEAAEATFRELLLTNPDYFNAYIQLGLIHKIEGKKDDAKVFFEKATGFDPENVTANFQLGLLLMESRNYAAAEKAFVKVLSANLLHGGALLNLGLVHGRMGDLSRATELIGHAYEQSSQFKDGFARLGWLRTESKDWSGALVLAKRDLEASRLTPVWRINLALLY
ncbi:MAG: tetratricopeptide repeat protein, partial [Deltaproteobacteria bacterium]|nr:tetratricopeptide repeat protein [Deltaproteobacteria bacterium]